jgi:hypothetical protein
MTIPEETLIAYADGELDAEARAAIEHAMGENPEISARIEAHRRLRQRLQAAFAAELEEPISARLLETVRGTRFRRMNRWRPALAIAASLTIGLVLGLGWTRRAELMIGGSDERILARGALARALSQQLGGEVPRDATVRVGISFVAKSGGYCRSFTLAGRGAASGLACRRGSDWQIEALNRQPATSGQSPDYRMAGSELDPLVRKAIEERISGDPLDQAGESAARSHDWAR